MLILSTKNQNQLQTSPEESYEPVDSPPHPTKVHTDNEKPGKKTKHGASGSLLGKSYIKARGKKSKKSAAHNGESAPYNVPTQRWLDQSAAEEPFRGFTTIPIGSPLANDGSSISQGNGAGNVENLNGE